MNVKSHLEIEKAGILPTLIFIPDISGFTEYMHTSENMHCRYIIAKLIETILDANKLELSISEIEGDAVLFYKFGEPPPIEKVIDQCKIMFNNFHKFLSQFNYDKLCDCKCCVNTNNLSLKFVVHYGKVSPVNIKNHQKLFGGDVMLSHKLLKNNIELEEYILITESYLNTQSQQTLKKIVNENELLKKKISYEHIGEIKYSYYVLSHFNDELTSKKNILPNEKEKSPITYSIYINVPPNFVKEIITDFKFKPNWITILNNITYDEKTIPRIGAKHRCIMNDIFFKPVIIDYESVFLSNDNKIYVEKLTSKLIELDAVLYFEMIEKGLGTELKLELHLIHTDFYSRIIKILFKRVSTKKRIKYSLLKLKFLCESIYNKYL